jgi:hypothetical protein
MDHDRGQRLAAQRFGDQPQGTLPSGATPPCTVLDAGDGLRPDAIIPPIAG